MTERAAIFALISDEAVRNSVDVLAQSHDIPIRTYASSTDFLSDLPIIRSGGLLLDLDAAGKLSAEFLEQLRQQGIALPAIIMTIDKADSVRKDLTDAAFVEKPAGQLIVLLKKMLHRD